MKLTAADLMTSPVVTARADMRVRELLALLHAHRITGVPVVDGAGRLAGVISLTDLAGLTLDTRGSVGVTESDFHTSPAMDGLASADGLLQPEESVLDEPIADLVSRHAITASEQARIGEVADLMVSRGVHRVLVVRGPAVVGIVSVSDILRGLRDWDAGTPEGGRA